ncbi:hypothetical protein F8E02_01875 [Methanoculleus sp. Wushi-C6]|uniref:DUF5050 domain-containing protein n=2 Tax=Methanoculleus caldifontis TaxID=2651577 RepID=A0ABU3WY93_9EURY|nr:hypothetical protein [Methanoculleus sp. Wushi-C6]
MHCGIRTISSSSVGPRAAPSCQPHLVLRLTRKALRKAPAAGGSTPGPLYSEPVTLPENGRRRHLPRSAVQQAALNEPGSPAAAIIYSHGHSPSGKDHPCGLLSHAPAIVLARWQLPQSRPGAFLPKEAQTMNRQNLNLPALALIALALLAGSATAAEHQVTNASVDQVYASVLDDRILWSDNRTGDYDVYLYNLTGETEQTLSPPGTDQFATALSAGMMMNGGRVVWEDNRSGNRDIYLYDLVTGEERQITNGTGHEINPAIAGDWIVWQDSRDGNWEIYLYDLATGEETRITENESVQMIPAVTASMVVWNDFRHGNWDIYAWTPDEAAPSGTPAPSAPGPALTPASPATPGAPGAVTLPPTATPTPGATPTPTVMPPPYVTVTPTPETTATTPPPTFTPTRTLTPTRTFPPLTFVTLEPTETPFLL